MNTFLLFVFRPKSAQTVEDRTEGMTSVLLLLLCGLSANYRSNAIYNMRAVVIVCMIKGKVMRTDV